MQEFDKVVNGLQSDDVLCGYYDNLDRPRRAGQSQGVGISQIIAIAGNAAARRARGALPARLSSVPNPISESRHGRPRAAAPRMAVRPLPA